jgi:LPXTG-motif cell wall-anchored protein
MSSGRTLPATGGQPVALALLGAGLLLAGVGLRLRLRQPVG